MEGRRRGILEMKKIIIFSRNKSVKYRVAPPPPLQMSLIDYDETRKITYLEFWPNSAELLGHYPRLSRKNLSSLSGGGGELKVSKGHFLLRKIFFYNFFSSSNWLAIYGTFEFRKLSEPPPPPFSDQNSFLYPAVKKLQIAKIGFLFFKKMQSKSLVPQIRTQKNFLAQRSGFRSK